MVIIFVDSIVHPTILLGQSSNPDYYSNPAGASQMVDLSTGNFHYSIPLLEVEGYPITLNYNAGVTMEQEASWVGLGWTLNPGAINRQMRGIPDDFKKEKVTKEYYSAPSKNQGGGLTFGVELLGMDMDNLVSGLGLNVNADGRLNSYTGLGLSVGFGPSVSLGMNSIASSGLGANLSGGLNFSLGNHSGLSSSSNLAFGLKVGSAENDSETNTSYGKLGFGRGYSYNSVSNQRLTHTSMSLDFGKDNVPTSYDKNENIDETGSMSIFGLSSTISKPLINTFSLPPKISFSTYTKSFDIQIKGGGETPIVPTLIYGGVRYNEMEQTLVRTKNELDAYGYLYMQDREKNKLDKMKTITDFNRYGEGRIHREMKSLPFSYLTHDLFTLSGATVGGSFRAKRSDYGTVGDNTVSTNGMGNDFGAEVGVVGVAEVGTNYSGSMKSGYYGEWHNEVTESLNYRANKSGDPLYQPYYFKMLGELTPSDESFAEKTGGDKPVLVPISRKGDNAFMSQKLDIEVEKKLLGRDVSITNFFDNYRDDREHRNHQISMLNAQDAKHSSVFPEIRNYNSFDYTGGSYPNTAIDRVSHAEGKKHHISAFNVTNTQGEKYHYGVPVYTRKVVSKSFNVSGNIKDLTENRVKYSGSDDTYNNSNGIDNYYNSRTTPAYASSFLLSGYFSSDYQDVTQNGPTPDDLGKYIKFNYTRTSTDFISRTPHIRGNSDNNDAGYDPGFLMNPNDDKGAYSYEEKELWYMHSMESKNYVVEFKLNDEDREDGYGVVNEDGQLESSPSKRYLKEINLYSRQDKLNNGSTAKPLKTIVFKYNYDLCPNYVGSNGKLTLEKLFIYDHTSKKGKEHPYEFYYDNNENYSPQNQDRWGYFKEQPALTSDDINSSQQRNDPLSNAEYPYTPQNKSEADRGAKAWNLSRIKTPQGSEIEVEYESDSYGYVQDVEAMKMYKVNGLVYAGNQLRSKLYEDINTPSYAVEVDISSDPVSSSVSDPEQYFIDRFLKSEKHGTTRTKYLSYNFLVKAGNGGDQWERVMGYMPIITDKVKLTDLNGNGEYETVLLGIKNQKTNEGDYGPFGKLIKKDKSFKANPISEMAWQNNNDYLSGEIIPGNKPIASGFEAIVMALEGMRVQYQIAQNGFYRFSADKGMARYIKPEKSFVRMHVPDKVKYGGGHRVKSITVTDNWDEFSDTYGTEYTYTTTDNIGDTISSGVASNEPFKGLDENAIKYANDPISVLGLSNYGAGHKLMNEMPFAGPILPPPGIVYSKVTSRSIDKAGVTINRTGYQEDCFYTAKDFPFKLKKTAIDVESPDPSRLFLLFYKSSKSILGATQGFSVELNDMHGKTKSHVLFDENGKKVEETYYHYKGKGNEIINKVNGIDNEGTLHTDYELGVERDFVIDSKRFYSAMQIQNMEVGVNFPAMPLPPGFYVAPAIPLLTVSQDIQEMMSITTNKITQKYGVLDRIVRRSQGAKVETKNLLRDYSTGRVLVSSETNHLDNSSPIYTYRFPAKWKYEALSESYENESLVLNQLSGILDSNSEIESAYTDMFHDGDVLLRKEVESDGTLTFEKVWVIEERDVNGSYTGIKQLIDDNGLIVDEVGTAAYSYRVIESGRKNNLSSDVQVIRKVESTTADPSAIYSSSTANDVLNVSAVSLNDRGKYPMSILHAECYQCSPGVDPFEQQVVNFTTDLNPFLYGFINNWHVDSNYVADVSKDYGSSTGQNLADPDLKNDGTFTIDPIYRFSGSSVQVNVSDDWKSTLKNMNYTSISGTVENKNILDNFSSTLFDKYSQKPVASVMNGELEEILFEDFEDFETNDYDLPVSYENSHRTIPVFWDLIFVSDEDGHTGELSMDVKSQGDYTMFIPIVERENQDFNKYRKDVNIPYRPDCYDAYPGMSFVPKLGTQKFTLSFWIKKKNNDNEDFEYPTELVRFDTLCTERQNLRISSDFINETNVIDGWKQVNYTFSMLSSDKAEDALLKISIDNSGSSTDEYLIDDIRIHPYEANMNARVYDRYLNRPVAELDENNFAIFYNYNSKGQVSVIKRETENGIQTVSERNSSLER
ncbi:hypothetical protein [Salibacter halophilus]|uniref:Uncharacterized protein n=1 Tax=Salibacter halophilus TaxID=1803916 RepID=A0A6N6M5T9_9FLAO|nr:hypothetical protein [Salibacter halophilus]KAB1064893.1 hypothetical protein F3059_05945 [Salibacter halophilus]